MGDLMQEIETLNQRISEIEEWAADLAGDLRQRTEELRQAAGKLEETERRYRKLVELTDELAQRLEEQDGTVRQVTSSIRAASGALSAVPLS